MHPLSNQLAPAALFSALRTHCHSLRFFASEPKVTPRAPSTLFHFAEPFPGVLVNESNSQLGESRQDSIFGENIEAFPEPAAPAVILLILIETLCLCRQALSHS